MFCPHNLKYMGILYYIGTVTCPWCGVTTEDTEFEDNYGLGFPQDGMIVRDIGGCEGSIKIVADGFVKATEEEVRAWNAKLKVLGKK